MAEEGRGGRGQAPISWKRLHQAALRMVFNMHKELTATNEPRKHLMIHI